MNKYIKKLLILFVCLFAFVLVGCKSEGKLSIGTEYIEKNMFVGDKIMLKATIADPESNQEIIWESEDSNIVTVNQMGLVEAVGVGKTTVYAIFGEEKCLVVINVNERIDFSNYSVSITGPQTVLINESINLKATVTPDDSQKGIIWKSSDDSIATVDQTGIVKGLKPGVATITAISEIDESISDDIIILVRTGDGIQDVIYNYIYENTYISSGDYDLINLSDKIKESIKKVENSVVGISYSENNTITENGTGGIYHREATDSGYKYLVFTNNHVVEGYPNIKVYLKDIDEYVSATVLKTDAEDDMAMLEFEHSKYYEVLQFADEKELAVGDFVFSMGHPGGYRFYNSVSLGICASPKRVLASGPTVYVQHDVSINPGNSGGPLFNLNGEVIGINTLKIIAYNTEGMCFSIALDEIFDFYELNI